MPPVEPTDFELMQRIAAGDRDGLAVLVSRYQSHVWGLAMRCVHRPQDADDIAQETFLRVWRAADRFQPRARFSTWLYRIVINLCLDAKRRGARTAVRLDDVQLAALADAPDDSLERRERIERVRRAVDELPQRQRIVLVLHRYQGLSHREVAEATGWSRSTIESLLVRAYANLRRQLDDGAGETG